MRILTIPTNMRPEKATLCLTTLTILTSRENRESHTVQSEDTHYTDTHEKREGHTVFDDTHYIDKQGKQREPHFSE